MPCAKLFAKDPNVFLGPGISEKDVLRMVDKPTEDESSRLFLHEGEDVFSQSRMPKTVHWSVPWSDLMMTMFILFAIMYIYKSPTRKVLSSQKTERDVGRCVETGSPVSASLKEGVGESTLTFKESISNIYDLSKRTVEARNLAEFASVDLLPDKAVRIILASDLLFDTGRADLKPKARRSLEGIAEIIRQVPYIVNVVGHTDNVPIHSDRFPTNWELSAIRACEVTRFLIEEMSIPARRFYVSGHSYYQPVDLNNTAESRAANRRVEVIITKDRPYGTPGTVENVSSPVL